ncbi:MAG: hypothetical protein ACE5F1_00305 [Planctomycetota bacterium]
MRFHLLLISSIAALSSLSVAQNQIEIYPGVTSFTSRGNISRGSGETLQGLHDSHWRGIGDNGKACAINSLYVVTQDQNASTRETFHWVIRKGTDAAGPTTGKAGEVAVIGPLQTPPSTSTTPAAWGLTANLTTPATLPSCVGHYAFGLRLGPSPKWTSDGQSTHASRQSAAASHANQGDHAWQIIGAATTATHPSLKRSWRYRVNALPDASPTCQVGNILSATGTPKNGMGGMYPNTAATPPNGLVATIRSNGNKSGSSVLLASAARTAGIPVFPGTSRAYVSPVGLLVLGTTTLDAQGNGRITIIGSVPTGLLGTVYVQALNFSTGFTKITMTNSHGFTLL